MLTRTQRHALVDVAVASVIKKESIKDTVLFMIVEEDGFNLTYLWDFSDII